MTGILPLSLAALLAGAAGIDDNHDAGPLPEAGRVRSMEARWTDFRTGERRAVAVPRDHIGPILKALQPAAKDENPASWETLGDLMITLEDGRSIEVQLYSLGGDRPGAFSIGPTPRERVYYRGGRTDALVKALRAAGEAAGPEAPRSDRPVNP